jgi:hypothetical protein
LEPRKDLLTAIENALAAILIPNFHLLALAAQAVPTSGSTESLRSRGYLLGLTEGLLDQFASLRPTQDEFVAAYASAFALTYGPCDWGWALDTIDEFQRENTSVVEGSKLGHRDVMTAYSDEPHKALTGFWLINSGDEVAIQHNLKYL